jgi:uncharacterized protein
VKIIDSHLHLAEAEGPMKDAAGRVGNMPTLGGLKREMAGNNVEYAVVITTAEYGIKKELKILGDIARKHDNIQGFAGIDPKMSQSEYVALEEAVRDGIVHGVKIYPSYFSHYPNDRVYDRAYEICERHKKPVILHTGAVMGGSKGRIYQKYAHPLNIDDLAVERPRLRILMAHAGYPWIIDAAQVAYKNRNVYMDFSGLREGKVESTRILDKHIMWAIDYVGDDKKIMYGSDWPLIRMRDYIGWLKTLVPEKMQNMFFYQNAKRFFKF